MPRSLDSTMDFCITSVDGNSPGTAFPNEEPENGCGQKKIPGTSLDTGYILGLPPEVNQLTLWKTNITMEHHHFLCENPLFLWAMFNSYVSLPRGRHTKWPAETHLDISKGCIRSRLLPALQFRRCSLWSSRLWSSGMFSHCNLMFLWKPMVYICQHIYIYVWLCMYTNPHAFFPIPLEHTSAICTPWFSLRMSSGTCSVTIAPYCIVGIRPGSTNSATVDPEHFSFFNG